MTVHELVLRNFASGRVVRIDHHFTGRTDEEVLRLIAEDRNERQNRRHRNAKWTVRVKPERRKA